MMYSIKLYNKIILSLTIIFFSCNSPSLSLYKNTSKNILNELSTDDWSNIWEMTSSVFRKEIDYNRMMKLKLWVNEELGNIVDYKMTYFYSGSSFGIADGYYVKSRYDVRFEKGIGEIEMVLVKEDNALKILRIDFFKKPLY